MNLEAKHDEFDDLKRKIRKKGCRLNAENDLVDAYGNFISNTVLVPIKEKSLISNNVTGMKVIEFECYVKGKKLNGTINCDIEKIDKELLKILQQRMGLDFKITRNNYLKNTYIDLSMSLQYKLKKVNMFDYIGWTQIDGDYGYIVGDTVISGHKKLRNYQVEIPENSELSTFEIKRVNISEKEAAIHVLGMLEMGKRRVTYPMFFFALLGLINSPLKEAGIDTQFILWIYGKTGSGKTTLAKLFFNYIKGNSKSVEASFKDTKPAIQHQLSLMRDCVAFFDDNHPPRSANERNELEEKVNYITRSSSDNSNRRKMDRDMKLDRGKPNDGNVCVTSEALIEGESALARCYPLEMRRGDIETNLLTKYEEGVDKYSTFLCYFIEWFSLNYQDKVSKMKSFYIYERSVGYKLTPHGRVNNQINQMRMVCLLFLDYLLEKKFIERDKAEIIYSKWLKITSEHLEKMETNLISQSPSAMYITAVMELISSNRVAISGKNESSNKSSLGWTDDKHIYLIPGITYTEVLRYWKQQNVEFPKKQIDIHKELDEENLIETSFEGGRKHYTVKAQNKKQVFDRGRVLKIKLKECARFLEGDDRKEMKNDSNDFSSIQKGHFSSFLNVGKSKSAIKRSFVVGPRISRKTA